MGHIYAGPYAKLAPELALVVVDAKGVAGYAVGTISTQDWEDRLERDWWPHLRLLYPDPPEALRDAWTPDQRRASMIHHPTRTPASVVAAYPAHLHMNLLPRAQGSGLGAKLFDEWRGIAMGTGVKAIHVGINRANGRATRFWVKIGFAELSLAGAAKGRTIWMGHC